MKRILVTGAYGFIGQNLVLRLKETKAIEVLTFGRSDQIETLKSLVCQADYIIHLAGENRPSDCRDFITVNVNLTRLLCDIIRKTERYIPIIFASSTQIANDNQYGESKLAAEEIIREFVDKFDQSAVIFRLPGVFGKWCKPNYNSVVATFCHNIANNLPIQINDPAKSLPLVYIDDVIKSFIHTLQSLETSSQFISVEPTYSITLQELADQLKLFVDSRSTLISERVGSGLIRALYSTYLSFLSPENFTYTIPFFPDERGMFAEVLKTKDSGQFSFFTTLPGVTRGQHFHHSKSEKFIIIKGQARFRFRHLISNERFEIFSSSDELKVVETIPGWVHDITNVGENENRSIMPFPS